MRDCRSRDVIQSPSDAGLATARVSGGGDGLGRGPGRDDGQLPRPRRPHKGLARAPPTPPQRGFGAAGGCGRVCVVLERPSTGREGSPRRVARRASGSETRATPHGDLATRGGGGGRQA